ncbi:Putative NAD(P)H nitroreductase Acg [Mycolicibacterium gilvum]|uniref:NAD(P)H nitroreductase n=2 Tax=Mycolicibacterium TaxID=1866885 RepID=A0ABQ0KRI7_MYCNV|nr:uncharacterized protein RMCN_5369 [Mycolicibacterium novocastrense]STZ41480.1 Putative NAD(P)H nitroreductase Acg [Mycolicibacterium gilvum]
MAVNEHMVALDVIQHALELAVRAPSLHNSQPWRWVLHDGVLDLHADPTRIGHGSDHTGKEVLLSCGAVLDHLRVAMAAAGWDSLTERFPNPNDRDHLATVEFARAVFVTDAQRGRAAAIAHRRTDRLAFAVPASWEAFETVLRATVIGNGTHLDVLDADARSQLAHASRLTEQLRRYDASYHAELAWWTTQPPSTQGIPPTALVSGAESARVDVGRAFPVRGETNRRADIDRDDAKILVLSTYDDSRDSVLVCGEVLSAVLLEATMADLGTCTLTHMIEAAASREIVRRLTRRTAEPQVLIRIGTAPPTDPPPPPTPRRPLTDVLEIGP